MSRTPILAAALLLAASCGGSPAAPATTVPQGRPVVLNAGPYTLTITLVTAGITPPSICADNPTETTATFNADLERSGSAATVRATGSASTLTLSLVVAATSVTGTITGSAREATGVSIGASGSVTGGVPSEGAAAVSGNIDGTVSIPGGFCFNNGHRWSLSPR
jgi:acyl-CoA synthetase (NDP forming)